MKFLRNITFLILLSSNCAFAFNLPDDEPVDTITLKEIEITANRLVNFTTGAKIQRITSDVINEYNSSNISTLLSQITPISIKSYGIAGLSEVSLRGMHSKHTAILWNGLNLQSSMNGGFDMNSIPSFIIDDINIQFGGSGALFGSGATGGVIHLNNHLKLEDNFEISFLENVASFTNLFEGLKINYSNEKFASSTRLFHKYGENDFKYVNDQQFGKPTMKLDNSASSQYGIMQSNLFKLKGNQKITTNIWAQRHFIEIPGQITILNSSEDQDKESIAIATVWNRNGEISSWYSRVFFNYESLIYRKPSISLISEMDHYSIVGEIENKTSFYNNFLLNIGINNTYQKVLTKNYGENKFRNRTAIYSSLKYFNNDQSLSAILSLREELVENEFTPFTYSFSTKYFVINNVNFHANISRTYNLPTLNDLYWLPGGYPELIPENGWSKDIGANFEYSNSHNHINIDLTYFDINLNNHIIWVDTLGPNYFAENVEKLYSRGIESNFQYKYGSKNWQAGINFNYGYTKSTYEESENGDTTSFGNQLLYIPVHSANSKLFFKYKVLNISIIHNFVGKKFTNKDNSNYVDPYYIADLALSGNYKFHKSEVLLQFKIHNIWNEEYEVMALYAMPQRYYSISLTYKFNNSNN